MEAGEAMSTRTSPLPRAAKTTSWSAHNASATARPMVPVAPITSTFISVSHHM
jgi:hypothetical protein